LIKNRSSNLNKFTIMQKSKIIKTEKPAALRRTASGRPTKYNHTVTQEICAAISDGMPYIYAAAIGGISYETFCQWRKKYPDFSDAIEAAKALGIRARLQLIVNAAESGDVAAARWWLEHVVPEHFARNRVELDHSVRSSVEHSFALSTEVLDAIAEVRKRHETS
jgi:hypothetical protein